MKAISTLIALPLMAVYGQPLAAKDIDLSKITRSQGYVVVGSDDYENTGYGSDIVGDVNGDGYEDAAIGIRGSDSFGRTDNGQVFVVYGTASGIPSSPRAGFQIVGAKSGDGLGASVARAGDLDGDGYDDLVIGAPQASRGSETSQGVGYIFYGAKTTPSVVDIGAASGRARAFVGNHSYDTFAATVAGIGDFNDDGRPDVGFGASSETFGGDSDGGAIYVVYGSATRPALSQDASSIPSSRGFVLRISVGDMFLGSSFSAAGDFDGDGVDDMAVGLPENENSRQVTGNYHRGFGMIFYGARGETGTDFDIVTNSVPDARVTFLAGESAGDRLSKSVSGIGDINRDGRPDVFFGSGELARGGEVGGGAVLFGGSARRGKVIPVTSLTGGIGFRVTGEIAQGYAGEVSAAAGDVNGDGYADFLLSAPFADPGGLTNIGIGYLVYGRASFPANLKLATLTGTSGFRLKGGLTAGQLVGKSLGGGDVNNDGFSDMIIGAPETDRFTAVNAGNTYVVFGAATGPIIRTGGNGPDTMNGGAFADILSGGRGGDTLVGRGLGDRLTGGQGRDVFKLLASTDSTLSKPDLITDFEVGTDQIDVKAIDADTGKSKDQAFQFIGTKPFSARGQVRLRYINKAGSANDRTIVEFNNNGKLTTDFVVNLVGIRKLNARSFNP